MHTLRYSRCALVVVTAALAGCVGHASGNQDPLSGDGADLKADGGADNRYCGVGDKAHFGTEDGTAQLPQRCVYSAFPSTSGYTVKTVCPASAGSCDFTTLSAAMAAASCGEVIRVQAHDSQGNQLVYDEPSIPIATQCTAQTGWVVVESDQLSNAAFPAEGTRISPCWAGHTALVGRPSFACPATPGAYVPKIRAPQGKSLLTYSGGTYWRFAGLELTTQPGFAQSTGVVEAAVGTTGLTGDHIVFDRVIVHGGDSPDGTNKVDVGRGIADDGVTSLAVVDSYLYDFICVNLCVDSQGITLGGNSPTVGEGPTKVVNNFVEASGENLFAGGGGTGATPTGSCCKIPSDIEIRRNHSFKPASIWQRGFPAASGSCSYGTGCIDNPTYYGVPVVVKNLTEFKTGKNVLIEGNLFENNWGGQSDQFGNTFQINPVSQNKHVYGCANSDGNGTLTSAPCASGQGHPIQFEADAISPYCADPNHCRVSMGDKPNRSDYVLAQTFGSATQITVSPALPAFTGQLVNQCDPGLNPLAEAANFVIRYNIGRHASRGLDVTTDKSQCGDLAQQLAHITIHDNQFDDLDGWQWNLKAGACCAWGAGVMVGNVNDTQATATTDVAVVHNTLVVVQEENAGTEGAVKVTNGCGPTCTATVVPLVVRDNLGGAGMTDDMGKQNDPCDAAGLALSGAPTLLQCLAPNQWCMTGNAFSLQTVPGLPIPSANTPWAEQDAGSPSPACPPGVPTFNFTPNDYTDFGFVSLDGGNGGDYRLKSTSPYKKQASDGKDVGADIALVNEYTAGVP